MKISIFVTSDKDRQDIIKQSLESYKFADEVIIVDTPWPKEFNWEFIGQRFQEGYDRSTGDWVIHMDSDFIFHEQDYEDIRSKLGMYNADAMTFHKYQIFTPDRYTIKSRLVLAVNKAKCGDRIKFNSGGDLCQPSLDGKYIDPDSVPETKIPVWNYECILKTKEQLMEDKGRFARAWQRTFGEYKLGGPDDESAYDEWWKMVTGRYARHIERLELKDHPKVMQETLKNLKPNQFGKDMFGYAQNSSGNR